MIKEFFRAALAAGLMLGALSASAATVTLKDASGGSWPTNGCSTYTALADSNGSITVTCTGGGSTAPSTEVTFVIIPKTMSPLTGAPMTVSVIRLIKAGGTPGSDTVTLSLSAGTTSPTPSFSSVTFSAADGKTSSKPAGSVTFASTGTATFSLGTGATATAVPVTVVPVTVISAPPPCPAFASTSTDDLALASLIAGAKGQHSVVPDPVTEKSVRAFKFTLPASGPISYTFGFTAGSSGSYRGKDVAISTCPGDFSAKGMSDPGQCFVYNANKASGIMVTDGSTGCAVSAGSSYYLNVRSRDVGETMGFQLEVQ